MATAAPTPLLEISTLVTRPIVKIDGRPYTLKNRDEFTYLAARGHRALFMRLGALMARVSTLSRKDERELSRSLADFCKLILIAPPAVHARLTDTNRWDLAVGFSTLLRPTPTAGVAAPAAPAKGRPKTGTR